MRDFMAALDARGDLLHVHREVDPKRLRELDQVLDVVRPHGMAATQACDPGVSRRGVELRQP